MKALLVFAYMVISLNCDHRDSFTNYLHGDVSSFEIHDDFEYDGSWGKFGFDVIYEDGCIRGENRMEQYNESGTFTRLF